MKKLTVITIATLLFSALQFAQAPDTLWTKTYGGMNADWGYYVQQTTDFGYIIVGATESFGAGNTDIYFIKTNSLGDTLWTRTYGGANADVAYCVQQTNDGGYMIAGNTESYGSGGSDMWLIKTDAYGNVIWSQTYGSAGNEWAASVKQTTDDGYIVSGTKGATLPPFDDVYIIKTDSLGNILWTTTWNRPYVNNSDRGGEIQLTIDDGYIIVGHSYNSGGAGIKVTLLKLNSSGTVEWWKVHGIEQDQRGSSVLQTGDSGYIFSAYTGLANPDFWLVKTDSVGDTLWSKRFGGPNDEYPGQMWRTADSGYVIIGYTASYGSGGNDVWLVKTDMNGNEMWNLPIGSTGDDRGVSVQQTMDQGFIIAGRTNSFGSGNNDIWLLKLTSEDNYPQFIQQGPKLVSSDYYGLSTQGESISISSDGNTVIVGGPNDYGVIGAAWIFSRDYNGDWTQQGPKLVGTGHANASQGESVSISADGKTVIVGGPSDDNWIGAVWIFTKDSSGVWNQQGTKLIGTGYIGEPEQGFSVSISGDGNTAIIGALTDDNGIGASWIFTRDINGVWSQQGSKLVGSDYVGEPYQGRSVSISADGNTAIVGGANDDGNIGAAWIFTRDINGVWSQQGPKLVGTGSIGYPLQGQSVSISADGSTAIVGGFTDNAIGAAWIFTRDINGVWSQQGPKLVGRDWSGTVPRQGQSVSISADGTTVVIGGYTDNHLVGAAWVFRLNNIGVWSQQGSKLVGTGYIGTPNQGNSVSISGDGNTIIIGGPQDDGYIGATWVFFNGVVPVELNSFTALVNENGVILNWTTATELNNQGFEIQRSQKSKVRNQYEWVKIGYVPGSGTTSEPRFYSFADNDLERGNYAYRLKQTDYDGTFEYSKVVEVEIESLIPVKFSLEQNYPNPFNPVTTIKYYLPSKNLVTLKVYNLLGGEVTTLVNEVKEAGSYEVEFSAENLASGIYFYKLESGNFVEAKKMVLLK